MPQDDTISKLLREARDIQTMIDRYCALRTLIREVEISKVSEKTFSRLEHMAVKDLPPKRKVEVSYKWLRQLQDLVK